MRTPRQRIMFLLATEWAHTSLTLSVTREYNPLEVSEHLLFRNREIRDGATHLKQFILKNLNVIFTVLGLILLVLSGTYSLLQIVRFPLLELCLSCTYFSLVVVSVSLALFFLGTHDRSLGHRREVNTEELQSLYSELHRYQDLRETENESIAESVAENVNRLKTGNGTNFELDVLPLRQALVGLYPIEDLVSKARYELDLLREYEEDDPDLCDRWRKRIERAIRLVELPTAGLDDEDELEELSDESVKLSDRDEGHQAENREEKLRAELKTLRETVAYYDKTYAEGEVIFNRVLYWAVISAFIALLIGLLPIVHSGGNDLLTILHWGALGVAGALLSVLVGIRDPSIPELGETHGKQVFQRTLLGIVIGSMAAILFYAALSGGILSGNLFPTVPIPNDENLWLNTGGSIFWSLFAGFSLRIFAGLVGIAEGTFARRESE